MLYQMSSACFTSSTLNTKVKREVSLIKLALEIVTGYKNNVLHIVSELNENNGFLKDLFERQCHGRR